MNDAFQLLQQMGKTFKMVSCEIRKELDTHGMHITRPQGMILRHLKDEDGIIQNDLAWITDRDKTTLARLLNKMESAELIYREVDRKDRRAKRVFITKKGEQAAQEIERVLTHVASKLMEGLSTSSRQKTQDTLNHIQQNLMKHCP